MARSNGSPKSPGDGFEGEISGLGLSDIIQLSVQNRFSGCIDVGFDDRSGLIFMKDGEIVHAEQGSVAGEEAFYEILSWPGGRFAARENVATTQTTIKKRCQFLILEAHRLMDERRAAGQALPERRSAPAAKPPSAAELLGVLRAVPGVVYAVILGKDGTRVGDDSFEGEMLAGQAMYVAMVGRRLGDGMQGGDLHMAAVHGSNRHVLLYMAKQHVIAVLVDAAVQVGTADAAIRKALTPGR